MSQITFMYSYVIYIRLQEFVYGFCEFSCMFTIYTEVCVTEENIDFNSRRTQFCFMLTTHVVYHTFFSLCLCDFYDSTQTGYDRALTNSSVFMGCSFQNATEVSLRLLQ
jgi:hypothetical protein